MKLGNKNFSFEISEQNLRFNFVSLRIWFGSIFAANKLSGYVQVIIDKLGMLQVFIIIPVFLAIVGALLLILNKKLEKMSE